MSREWLVIAGMALATCLPRVIPILLLPGKKIPRIVKRWLSYIAPAILAALLAPELFLDRSNSAVPIFSLSNIYSQAAIPAIIVAWKTRSLLKTVTTGIIATAIIRLLFHL